MKSMLKIKRVAAGCLAAALFALFALTTAVSAPVVVVPGEGAGYIYYSASGGASATPTPAEDPTLIGQVSAFVKLPLPDNWVACEGQSISATTYPELVHYLAGAAATSATIPDLRGYFLRGAGQNSDGTGGVRTPLSKQGDDNKAHSHTGTTGGLTAAVTGVTDVRGAHVHGVREYAGHTGNITYSHIKSDVNGATGDHTAWAGDHQHWFNLPQHTHPFTTANTGGVETRPINIAVIYAMRAK